MQVTTEHLNLDNTFQGLSADELQAYAAKRLPSNFDEQRKLLLRGEYDNPSEGRKVTHVLNRSRHSVVAAGGGRNRFSEVVRLLRSGKWLGATGKPITDVVNIGVGGSDLGPMMGSFALREFADDNVEHKLDVHFVSSMDGGQLYAVLPIVDPETTLFIIASKSFGTIDTLANVETVKRWIAPALAESAWLEKHVIGVSSNNQAMTEFGIPASQQLSFADSVGGRYSLWSAIGLPIALTIGANQFAKMLDGARFMDEHFGSAPLLENIPLLLALHGVYNREERGLNNVAVLPYDGRLRYLPSYLQQLDMESNGKQVARDGSPIDYPTGPIIWGGFGPNGQHAFFQHLHQGYDDFAADFVAVLHRQAPGFSAAVQEGLISQQRLSVANCLAHRRLMWFGNGDHYPGKHPSNLLYVDELTPQSFGALLAAYEHKVFAQGVIWDINSFDQPGVEHGKKVAKEVLAVLDGQRDESFDDSTDSIIKRM
ncbi:glucose-6-phosphate isomerase [Pseudidiomarina sp. 1ASP75-14]|uniref:glucose-6-phosphate isomerase n=1 Tax=Pseudidiomarina terrestris TaxID=2820060 RepID=UPI00264E81A3|nr:MULTISPECIES: glucose-6-phosphate isomerase [unclassified Pseudidiomarina]MDN7126960.1 glucose-6-phosphate isomerase [Pseudidiomarina sp. 1APR75-33.1]MDN7136801.1 glucose-6-phosphate isomerase [Pseudidiomarina sp. 1ASP75-14]